MSLKLWKDLIMCPWRIILRNTEEKDDIDKDATHTDQCCLPVIKYKTSCLALTHQLKSLFTLPNTPLDLI